jgi:polyferredoxin
MVTYSDRFDIAMFNVNRSENIKCTRCSRGVSRVNWKCPNIKKAELPRAALPVCTAVRIHGNGNCMLY